MFAKVFLRELKASALKFCPLALICVAVTLLARLILSFSNAVAVGGKPPFIDSAVSYLSYAALILLPVTVFICSALMLIRRLRPMTMSLSEYFATLLASFVCIAGSSLICFGGNLLLLSGGSYYEYYFGALLPPLCFDTSAYGVPFVVISLPVLIVCLMSLLAMISGAFAFASGKKYRSIAAMGAFLVLYVIALVIALVAVLSDVPSAAWFSGFLVSGSYSDIIAAGIAVAFALAISGGVACLSVVLMDSVRKGRG